MLSRELLCPAGSLEHTQRLKLLEQPARAAELQQGHRRDQEEEAASSAAQKVTYQVCMDAKNHQRYGGNGKEELLLIFHLV